MKIEQIERNLNKLFTPPPPHSIDFVYKFLQSFGFPQATITRTKNSNQSHNEVILRHRLLFRIEQTADLYTTIDQLKERASTIKRAPRFIVVTDFEKLLAIDLDADDTLSCKFNELPKKFTFFLPLAGIVKQHIDKENVVDVKVAAKIAELYDLVEHDNPKFDRHALNVFFARLLFCFFAEDTGIFGKNLFTESIASHTQPDGSDLSHYLKRLFARLNDKKNTNYPQYLAKFPYTNGGLFCSQLPIPNFPQRSRALIIACGKLHWREITPDIFGSIIQAAIAKEDRNKLGVHYTSPENILKVIKPLFLDNLYSQLTKAGNSKKKLNTLLDRLANLRIFDPACGSGNFLIVTYRELRKLEMEILDKLCHKGQRMFHFSTVVNLKQFYGIEIVHFACEIAKLSLYLIEHLMNLEFESRFLQKARPLPLEEGGNIIHANALRINWHEVCPRTNNKEIYLLGNPPYVGTAWQSNDQKKDMDITLGKIKKHRSLDYVTCWFYKGAQYLRNANTQLAFVSTNSIIQGQQVAILWLPILKLQVEIDFAYRSFKWTNKAKGSAGVSCVIIGLRNKCDRARIIYDCGQVIKAKNINPYLLDADNVVIGRHQQPLANFPKINLGNMPRDGGNLLLESHEKELIASHPKSNRFIRKIRGSEEHINGKDRWCLWISDEDLPAAQAIPEIAERIDKVKKFRLASSRKGTVNLAKRPHQFDSFKSAQRQALLIPRVSSEHRPYLQIGFLDHNTVISSEAFAIYDSPIYLFSLISSTLHMLWVKVFSGKLGTGVRYSSDLCYNTFPVPELSTSHKYQLEECTRTVIEAREQYPERTLAQLYDAEKMPDNLQEAHQKMDRTVERLYQKKPFTSDDERLACLLKLYSEMEKKVA